MNEDQVKGRIGEVKEAVKEAAGKVVGDRKMEKKGKVEKNMGKIQASYGDLKEDVKKAT